jgi:hypothetical protein
MRITLSERLLSEQIRQLEGLDPATSIEEISHGMVRYFRRLAEHVKLFGVELLATDFQQSGSIATMGADLKQSHSEDDIQTRLNGIRMLAPLSVSLEPNDLAAFVTDKLVLVTLQDSWSTFGNELQRVAVSEIRSALENIARKVLFTPSPEVQALNDAGAGEEAFQLFLQRAGRKDPMARHNAIEEYNRQEVEAVQAANERAYERFRNGE